MPARESEGSGPAYEAGAIGDDGAAAGAGAFAGDDGSTLAENAASPVSTQSSLYSVVGQIWAL